MSAEAPFLGRGWAFPPTFVDRGVDVEMVSGTVDIHQSLQILLRTTCGERVMREEFGCDLTSIQFAEVDRRLLNEVERLVTHAILMYEPRIDLEGLTVGERAGEAGCIDIGIRYRVRGTNSRFNMVVPFYTMEPARAGS